MNPIATSLMPVSVNQSSGSGSSRRFVVTSTDPAGTSDILRTCIVFDYPGSSAACYVVYFAGGLYLLKDGKTESLPPVTPGLAQTAENSQCVELMPPLRS
jgi:hypothetical protein